jgi:flavin-dependent dehydrogenase
VLLLDREPEEALGGRVSYDSVPPDVFPALGLPAPEGPELDGTGHLLRIFSPSRLSWVDAQVPNLLVHRLRLSQRLLRLAREAGVAVEAGTTVAGPLLEGGKVAGVLIRAHQDLLERRARVVIDATGFAATLRRQLPPELLVQEPLSPEDTLLAYREVRQLVGEGPVCPPAGFPGYYDYLGYFGGYLWVVREEGDKANLGVGVQARTGYPGPREVVERFAAGEPCFGRRLLSSGPEPVRIALRTCQPQLAAPGFLVAGEAACQVRPSTAYGVHPGLLAGTLAGEVAAKAVAAGDTSLSGLWEYDLRYKRGLGATYAFFDAFRLAIQSLANEEVEELLGLGLLGGEELSALWNDRTFPVTPGYLLSKLPRGAWRRPGLAFKAALAARTAGALESHYQGFPENPEGLPAWHRRTLDLYAALRRGLGAPPAQAWASSQAPTAPKA